MTRENGCIKIDKLSFSIGERKILDDISFNIKKGYFCSIIGPNGSGKTTLLKHLCNIIQPEKGKIMVEDMDVLDYGVRGLAKTISYVPQDTGIEYDFSVEDVVIMGRAPHLRRFEAEGAKDIEIAQKAMEMTNTLNLRKKNVKNLSGGERQRVVIARALAQEGSILLLDEPTSHLDIQHQIELMDTVKMLNLSKKITVVAVLHDLNLAAAYSDYLVMLSNGRVEAYGTPEDVLTVDNIRKVYNLDTMIMKNPINGKPHIIAKPGGAFLKVANG